MRYRSMPDQLMRLLAAAHDDHVRDIFLCGKAESGLRDKVRASIEEPTRRKLYNVYYPEEMFYDLLHGHDKKSLLDLENYLASSVDLIAIIVESPGAIAELGSFANLEALTDKIVVFNDKKYVKERSFINYGPMRKLRKRRANSVFQVDFNRARVQDEIAASVVREANRCPSKHIDFEDPLDLNNMSAVQDFCYLSMAVAGPVGQDGIGGFLHQAARTTDTDHITNAVLRNLQRHGLVRNTVRGWLASDVETWIATHKHSKHLRKSLDDLRLFWLNLCLRKERLSSTAQL